MSVTAITPCLWFDRQAEEAAGFYTSIFPRSHITAVTRYPEARHEIHGMPAGAVMTVGFELDGQPFTALNGGPMFTFNEAISLQVLCDTQAELDRYWSALGEGGDPRAQQCGWLKDRFGVSWQVTPKSLPEMLRDGDAAKVERAMQAMLAMKKFDISAMRRAFEGEG